MKFSQNDDSESIETKVIVSGYAIIFNGNVTLSTNIDIAKQNYIPGPSPTQSHFKKYKNQPFEKPSYALMEYFKKHDFISKLAMAIKIKQNTFIHE